MTPTTWVEMTVRLPLPAAEMVAEALVGVAAGVSVEPVIESDEAVDFAYRVTAEPALLRASFVAPFPTAARRALRRRLVALPLGTGLLGTDLPRLRYREVLDTEWEEAWKRGFTRQAVGRRLVVTPSWEPYEAQPGELVITLDPGRAFGTGQHATTRLCLAALEREYDRAPGGSLLDVGTGSGMLAIAGALLGAAPVVGVDIDAGTVPVAAENIAANGVTATVRAGSVGDDWPWAQPARADVVAANLTPAVLVALAAPLAAAINPGGALIVSGFTSRRAEVVLAALTEQGLTVEHVDAAEANGDHWRCVTLRRPGADA